MKNSRLLTIFALYAQAIGLSSQTTGYVLAYVGLLSGVVQGGLIGLLTRRFRENWLIITGLWLMTGALLAWAVTFAYRGIIIPAQRARLAAEAETAYA